MKYRILTLVSTLLLSVLIGGCSERVKIENVAVSETITLESNTKTPDSIMLAFEGRIDGEARISLMLDGEPYKTEELNGDIDFEWRSDWYSPQAILEYEHWNTKSGSLTISYGF